MPRKAQTIADQIAALGAAQEALAKSRERLEKQQERRVAAQSARRQREAIQKSAGAAPTAESIARDKFGVQHDSPGFIEWDANDPHRATSAMHQRSVAVTADMAEIQVDQIVRDNDAARDRVAAMRALHAEGQPGHNPGTHRPDGSLR